MSSRCLAPSLGGARRWTRGIILAASLALLLAPVVASATTSTSVGVGATPIGVVCNPNTNMVYTSNYDSGNVTAINGATGSVVGTFTVGANPKALVVDRVRNKLFVANAGPNNSGTTVSAIDLATNAVSSITVGTGPLDLVVDEVAGRLYVANFWSHNVTVIDAATSLVTTTVAVGQFPNAIALNNTSHKVYTTNQDGNSVTVIDAAAGFTSTSIGVGWEPRAVDVNQTTGEVYVCDHNGVSVIDGTTNEFKRTAEAGNISQTVAVDEVTGKVYVANQLSSDVTVIDVVGGYTTKQLMTGGQPTALAINSSLGKIYVSCVADGWVRVIDRTTDAMIDKVTVGLHPFGMALNETDRKVYTANSGASTVSWFQAPPPPVTVRYRAGAGGSLEGSATQSVEPGGSATEVEAKPDTGYRFVNWTGTGSIETTTANPLTVENVTEDATYTANFTTDWTYRLDGDDNATIIGYAGTDTTITIPAVIDGYPVVAIDDLVFLYRTDLTSVSIPEGVTSIGAYAFYGCSSLTSMSIPAGVTSIRDYTFYGCSSLTDVALPEGLNSIGFQAFRACSNLTSVTFPSSLTSIGEGAYEWCSNLTDVTIPAGVTSVGRVAFYGCERLTSATFLGNAPTTSGAYMFSGAWGIVVHHYRAATGFPTPPAPWAPTGNPDEGSVPTAYLDPLVAFVADTGGSIEGSATQIVATGSDCSAVTANQDTGHHFTNWTGTGSFETTTANPLTVTNVTADTTVTAHFAPDTFTVSFDSMGGSDVSPVSGVEYDTPLGAGMPADPTLAQHTFVGWNTASDGTGTAFDATTPVTTGITVYAQWAATTYTVSFEAGKGGTVEGATPQVVESGSGSSEVTATAGPGYHFENWTGTGSFETTTANPLTVTNVTADMTVTASFAINVYRVAYRAGIGGVVSDGQSTATVLAQNVEYGSDASAVSALADDGYRFVKWSDESTANPRTDTVVSSNATYTANFELTGVPITATTPSDGTFLDKWGSGGDLEPGIETAPLGIAVAPNGDVYVSDLLSRRVRYFNSAGVYQGEWNGADSAISPLSRPFGIAVAPNGDVYVSDMDTGLVQYFDSNGAYQGYWGGYGSQDGEMKNPTGLAIAPNGDVYVSDAENNRIQYFSATGTYKGQWNSEGTEAGTLSMPYGLAVAPNGDVYVADAGNGRIQYFDSTGTYKGQLGGPGTDDGQFSTPVFVSVAPNSDVYVTDMEGNRVEWFSATGTYLGQWGTGGVNDGQFSQPTGIAIAPNGDAYVADMQNSRIQHFGARGTITPSGATRVAENGDATFTVTPDAGYHLKDVTVDGEPATLTDGRYSFTGVNEPHVISATFEQDFPITAYTSSNGEYLGTLESTGAGVAVAPNGIVYVADSRANRIRYYSSSGDLLGSWGGPGFGDGEFDGLADVAVAPNGDVYATDQWNGRVQYFDATGTYKGQWGSRGVGGQFGSVIGVAIASDGTVYVTDGILHSVQYFTPTGEYKGRWGAEGTDDGQFQTPVGIAVAPSGDVYVGDVRNYRVQYFSSTGTYKGQWGTEGTGAGQFYRLMLLDVAPNGDVYVPDVNDDDPSASRVQYFSATGTYRGQLGGGGSGVGQFTMPLCVAFAPNGHAYVSDFASATVQYFGARGTISPAGVTRFAPGADATFAVTPDAGYKVASVLVDDEPVSLTDGVYTFTNVTGAHSIVAAFELDLTANDDAYDASANETTTVDAPGVLGNDSGSGLSAQLESGVSHGALSLSADGGFTYAPDMNYSGTDAFTYSVTNGDLTSAPATVTISVLPRPYQAIEGTITAGGAPLGRIVVTAFDAANDRYEQSVFTDAAGRYRLWVRSGYHHLRFTKAADGVLAEGLEQYYRHVVKITDAPLLRLLATEALVVSDDLTPMTKPAASITGTVTASGLPLERIVVTAYDSTTHRDVKGVFTDAAGGYSITGIPAGTYHVRFGVTSPASMTQYFDHKVPISEATVLTLTAGGTLTVSSDLAPAATQTISGVVTASEVPQNRIVVSVFNATTHAHVKGVFTNANGEYSISGIPAGTYHLRFTGTTPSNLTQFYDHQARIANASVLALDPGATLTVTTDLSGVIAP
ncbi:MAG: leucine-rich repeat protein [Coriobacteriia bacterium]|nr:leucine-rich repeat protein [Coriobacteriia bacterium]